MDTITAASKLNVTPKKLRRIIRKNPGLVAKVDGEYTITDEILEELEFLLNPAPRVNEDDEIKFLDQDEPMQVTEISRVWQDRAIRARATAQYRSRQARLLARMSEVGVG